MAPLVELLKSLALLFWRSAGEAETSDPHQARELTEVFLYPVVDPTLDGRDNPMAAERRADSRAIAAVIHTGALATAVDTATAARVPAGMPSDRQDGPYACDYGAALVRRAPLGPRADLVRRRLPAPALRCFCCRATSVRLGRGSSIPLGRHADATSSSSTVLDHAGIFASTRPSCNPNMRPEHATRCWSYNRGQTGVGPHLGTQPSAC